MNLPKKVLTLLLTAGLIFPLAAMAAPQVNLTVKAEKDVTVEENGKPVTKRVLAETVAPGETVIYTISYVNAGKEAAMKVAIVDPIPTGMTYLTGTASNTDDLTFSIDGGKTYKMPSLLTYEVQNPNGSVEKRVATPEKYTHVRWLIPTVPPGATGSVSFQVRMQ